LVSGGYPVERCDQERQKCRLLFQSCHRLHSAGQMRRYWKDYRGVVGKEQGVTPSNKRQRR
jgi:hypothetical protein